MSPCGEITDYVFSNSFQRFHFWTGPEDWRWVRWYRARQDALSMDDLFSLAGFAVWETDVERDDPRGIPLTPSRYCGADLSVHNGLHRFGPDEYFTDGLETLPDGPAAFPTCGGTGWDTRVVYRLHVFTGDDGFLSIDGGGSGGGRMTVTDKCILMFGSCVHMPGGGSGGGRMGLPHGYAPSMSGGGSGGGPLAIVPPPHTALGMHGGGSGGGALSIGGTVAFGAGSGIWTAPSSATSARVQLWGGGGGAAVDLTGGGGGGGGGGYAEEPAYALTGGSSYSYLAGAGGAPGAAGGGSTFGPTTTPAATGGGMGVGQVGGAAGTGTGTITSAGGFGGAGDPTSGGGGGGGSGGPGGAGVAGTAGSGGVGGAGGAGSGAGGAGGDGGADGITGGPPGGGGGGAGDPSRAAGSGADGAVYITWS